MDIIRVILMSLFSLIALFILTKIMGNKQLSQMTTFDYITGITIGSIAAEMAIELEFEFHKPLIAMITYGLVAVLLSIISNKSLKFRRFIDGTSLILYDNGTLYKKNFKKSNLNLSEFLMECRINGYPNIADIQTVILEPNGKISILPKSEARPVTNRDMNISQQEEKMPVTVILDGVILKENLKFTGNNDTWLKKQLEKQNIKKVKDVFYASCDNNNNLSVYTCVKENPDRDIFQ